MPRLLHHISARYRIDTLEVPLPAVSMLKSHDFAAEKCGCFRGPKTAVHFAEKY